MEKELQNALRENNPAQLRKLLEEGANPNTSFDNFEYPDNPIGYAIKKGYVELVDILLSFGADPTKHMPFYGVKAIHLVGFCLDQFDISITKRIKMVKLFAKYGVNMNAKDCIGRTLLHFVILNNRCDMDKLITAIIKAGADMNAKDDDEQTPLHCACLNMNNFYLIPRLIRAGADMNAKNSKGESIIVRLLKQEQGRTEICRYNPYGDDDEYEISDYTIMDYFLQTYVKRTYIQDIKVPVKMLIEEGAQHSTTSIDDYSKVVADRLPDDVLRIVKSYINEDDALDIAIDYDFDEIAKLIAKKRNINLQNYKDMLYEQRSKIREDLYFRKRK